MNMDEYLGLESNAGSIADNAEFRENYTQIMEDDSYQLIKKSLDGTILLVKPTVTNFLGEYPSEYEHDNFKLSIDSILNIFKPFDFRELLMSKIANAINNQHYLLFNKFKVGLRIIGTGTKKDPFEDSHYNSHFHYKEAVRLYAKKCGSLVYFRRDIQSRNPLTPDEKIMDILHSIDSKSNVIVLE